MIFASAMAFPFLLPEVLWKEKRLINSQLLIPIQGFVDNDIRNDVKCAKLIFDQDGFKAWNGWTRNCKGKSLPTLNNCNLHW